jgi:PhnB protein
MAKKIKKKAASVKKPVAKKTKKAVKATKKPAKATATKGPASAAKRAAKASAAKRATRPSVIINPYLNFKGNCEEAFNYYRSVFGGNFAYVGRFKEMPTGDGHSVPASEGEKIMHISLPISRETVLMGSDTSEAFGQVTTAGDNFAISITTASQALADKLYRGLSAGGKETMPMNKTFWGSYFGMLTDKFGIQWMISFDGTESK